MNNYPPIMPYLAVEDAGQAIEFYKTAFGAEEKMRVPGPEGRGVAHAEVMIHDGIVLLADQAADKNFVAPKPGAPLSYGLMLGCGTPQDVDATYRRAIKAGGTSESEPEDAAWGSRFAGVIDPFGHRWWLHAPLAK